MAGHVISQEPITADMIYNEGAYFDAVDNGYLLQTISPLAVAPAANAFQPTSGTVYLFGCRAANGGASSIPVTYTQTAGATLTATDNQLGLYTVSSAGICTLVAQSVDQSTVWAATAGKQASTWGTTPTATVYTAGAVNYYDVFENIQYYVGLLAVGTTMPKFWASSVASLGVIQGNTGVVTSSVAQVPFVTAAAVATSATTLPATVNLGTATVTVQTQVPLIGLS